MAQEPDKPLAQDELIRLFSILSHDLKSPIFAVDGFSELLLADYGDKLDEEGQDFLRRIRAGAQHMKRVLDDMSHLVKVLARPNTKSPTPLREIIEEVLHKYNYLIEEGGVRVDLPADLPVVNADAEKLREALGAIVSNALFFTDRASGSRAIAIESASVDSSVRICVRDNGTGIDPRYAHQVFDIGGASKLDKQRGGGPGYGLYLAKRIVESHGGELSVESKPGEGSTFCLTIPE
jgi:signal transduction histidine kinase